MQMLSLLVSSQGDLEQGRRRAGIGASESVPPIPRLRPAFRHHGPTNRTSYGTRNWIRSPRAVLSNPLLNAVEITFERADDPLRLDRYLGQLEFDYVSVHALKLSVGSPDPPSDDYLRAIGEIAGENGAASISDHLGFTRDGHGGVELGPFSPLPPTQDALDAVSRNVDLIQSYFGPLRFFLENIAYLFRMEGTMSEMDFLSRILRRTGCGWLMDVTNIYANARNFGFNAYDFVAEVAPAASRLQMHLSGCDYDEQTGLYIDSHAHSIPEPVWDLYWYALEEFGEKVDAIFIERDQNFPDNDGDWGREIRKARKIVDEATGTTAINSE